MAYLSQNSRESNTTTWLQAGAHYLCERDYTTWWQVTAHGLDEESSLHALMLCGPTADPHSIVTTPPCCAQPSAPTERRAGPALPVLPASVSRQESCIAICPWL